MNRAYAVLHVCAVDDEQREITGLATTPEPDRHGDVIEPLGVTFKNPIPLLLFHDTQRPVGLATFKKPTKDGVEFKATLPTIHEPGTLKDRVDEAWQSIKAGLVSGVSIGFRAIEESFNKATGGFHFLQSEVLELSLVTIPANAEASIHTIKQIDQAAMGRNLPGASGLPVVRAMPRTKGSTMTTAEQITAFEATRAAKSARMNELMAAAAQTNTTLDAAQTEEYDGLELEVRSVDAHLVRLRALEKSNAAAATPITPSTTPAQAAQQRGGQAVIQVKANLPKGTALTRYVQAKAYGRGDSMKEIEFAKQWRDSTPEVELVLKAAVAAGTTTDATWAGPLAALQPMASEFLELLRPATILGRLPGLRRVPFNVSVPAQTGGGTYAWVGQGAPKPVGKLAFATVTLAITKAAGIIAITKELAKVSSPSAEETIRRDMIAGMAAYLDSEFVDPTKAAVANVSPGSVTNGVTPITSAGTSGANAKTDVQAMAAALVTAGISVAGAVLLTSETNAIALAGALNPLGQPLFPSLGVTGGTGPMGITVIASQTCANHNILLQPDCILYADDGGLEIDVSEEASVQMDSAPDNPALATTVFTSFWQSNLIGLRADRFINWKKARTGCVQMVDQTYVS